MYFVVSLETELISTQVINFFFLSHFPFCDFEFSFLVQLGVAELEIGESESDY